MSPRPTIPLLGSALWALSSIAPALAQDGVERPELPAWSMAGDDGAPSLWRNPGNLALDPDPSWALIYDSAMETDGASGFSAVGNTGPLAMGVSYSGGPLDPTWWTVSSGLALRLDRELSLGVHLGWQIPEGIDNNFATWDTGLSWRPLPWLGAGAVFQNIGVSERPGISPRSGAGLVFRPWGDRAQLGVDVFATDLDTDQPGLLAQGTLRVEPVDGLVLRAYGDQEGRVGGGLEVWFGRVGAGAHGLSPLDGSTAPVALAYARSERPARRLMGGGKQVPEFEFDKSFPYQPVGSILSRAGESYTSLLFRMERAVEDPDVAGILLKLDATPFSMAQIEELRTLMADARAHGKPVVAYLDRASSNSAYLLATSADRVYLHPAGGIDLVGLSAEIQYFRGAFDLVGVEPQFAKRSKYKSAPEGYTDYGASPAAKEQMDALLDDLHGHFVDHVAKDRQRTPEQVQRLLDNGPYSAREAEDKGLVDGLCYEDELPKRLDPLLPKGFDFDDSYATELGVPGWKARHEVALIYVTGAIVSGPSSPPGLFGGGWTAGSETVTRQLQRAAAEDSVKAVVLRVDSPGGSAFASDEIWRAVELVKLRGKPVIVSMGGVAASGGYYVSAGADAIFAEPTTITGSIGVYSGKFSIGGLYEKLGITTELYTRGRNAGMYATSRPMDEVEFAAMDRMVGETYNQFKERVAEGRGLSEEEVEAVAQGRVWSGQDALEQGLVDELGGLRSAIERAELEAGIPSRADVGLVTYDYRLGPNGEVSRQAIQQIRTMLGLQDEVPLSAELELLHRWRYLEGERVWAVLPYHLEID